MELPRSLKMFLLEAGDLSAFTGRFFREAFRPRYEWAEFIRQCFRIGYKYSAADRHHRLHHGPGAYYAATPVAGRLWCRSATACYGELGYHPRGRACYHCFDICRTKSAPA